MSMFSRGEAFARTETYRFTTANANASPLLMFQQRSLSARDLVCISRNTHRNLSIHNGECECFPPTHVPATISLRSRPCVHIAEHTQKPIDSQRRVRMLPPYSCSNNDLSLLATLCAYRGAHTETYRPTVANVNAWPLLMCQQRSLSARDLVCIPSSLGKPVFGRALGNDFDRCF